MINTKTPVFNRFLIVAMHVVGWIAFILGPILFMQPNRHGPRHPRPAPGAPAMPGGPGGPGIPPDGGIGMAPPHDDFDWHTLRIYSLVFNILLAAFFYFNMYVLIPRVFTRKSWGFYLAAIVTSFAAIVLINELVYELLSTASFRPGRPFYFTVLNFLLVFGLSTALRLTSDRVQFERQRKESETERLKSELSLLRSQVSPHFMFNVLNNLASLARKKSDQLEPVIIQLSHLMRYMLYDSGEKRVTVAKEIEYLESYIDLQRLRFGQDVTIDFVVNASRKDLPIEPMLLIPFVENAFKHGMGVIRDPLIMITLSTTDTALNFTVRNKFGSVPETKDARSGIGIQNVRRRLDLLYKDLHELRIYDDGGWYIVELKLILQ